MQTVTLSVLRYYEEKKKERKKFTKNNYNFSFNFPHVAEPNAFAK